MRCPKCGYISFDQVERCDKCGKDVQKAAEELGGVIPNVAIPEYLFFVEAEEEEIFAEKMEEQQKALVEAAPEAVLIVDDVEEVDREPAALEGELPEEVQKEVVLEEELPPSFDSGEKTEAVEAVGIPMEPVAEKPVEEEAEVLSVAVEQEEEEEHEIEMDMSFFSAPANDPPKASVAARVEAYDVEKEEEIEFAFEDLTVAKEEESASEECAVPESSDDNVIEDVVVSSGAEKASPLEEQEIQDLFGEDFDLDLDLGDLDLVLDKKDEKS